MQPLPLFVQTPMVPGLEQGLNDLARGQLFHIHRHTIHAEVFPILTQSKPCVILFSVTESCNVHQLVHLLKDLQKYRVSLGGARNDSQFRLIVMTKSNEHVSADWAGLGVSELMMGVPSSQALSYKLSRHYQKALVDPTQKELHHKRAHRNYFQHRDWHTHVKDFRKIEKSEIPKNRKVYLGHPSVEWIEHPATQKESTVSPVHHPLNPYEKDVRDFKSAQSGIHSRSWNNGLENHWNTHEKILKPLNDSLGELAELEYKNVTELNKKEWSGCPQPHPKLALVKKNNLESKAMSVQAKHSLPISKITKKINPVSLRPVNLPQVRTQLSAMKDWIEKEKISARIEPRQNHSPKHELQFRPMMKKELPARVLTPQAQRSLTLKKLNELEPVSIDHEAVACTGTDGVNPVALERARVSHPFKVVHSQEVKETFENRSNHISSKTSKPLEKTRSLVHTSSPLKTTESLQQSSIAGDSDPEVDPLQQVYEFFLQKTESTEVNPEGPIAVVSNLKEASESYSGAVSVSASEASLISSQHQVIAENAAEALSKQNFEAAQAILENSSTQRREEASAQHGHFFSPEPLEAWSVIFDDEENHQESIPLLQRVGMLRAKLIPHQGSAHESQEQHLPIPTSAGQKNALMIHQPESKPIEPFWLRLIRWFSAKISSLK